ncbi:MAG: PDDEXK nuclease domain-containing protein [Elusimicrobia bacterium]|nr:PDDEXK nuclease domain-containing protein [Elusimicrobiota bacterium]
MLSRKDSRAVVKGAAASVSLALPAGYREFLEDVKSRIRSTQGKAALSASRELLGLYWDLGKSIVERQEHESWGKAVVERLAADLHKEFPGVGGFSGGNLWRMRAFFRGYSEVKNLAQPARDLTKPILAQLARELTGSEMPAVLGRIPWFHNVILIEKIKDPLERLWYAHQAVEHGWSRDILAHQIDSGFYDRQGQAVTNFKRTLPASQSDLAHQTIKDPYMFDFLTLADDARERQLEQGLVNHIQKFLLELGVGFAFVGRQVHLEVEGEDFFIDLLFYHLRLRCFIVIELKNGPFKPEYAGKMNFYLSAVDDRLRHEADQPSIGMILCRSRKKLIAEYALRDTHKPIGVSAYKLTKALPEKLKGTLPTIKDLEMELKTGGRE